MANKTVPKNRIFMAYATIDKLLIKGNYLYSSLYGYQNSYQAVGLWFLMFFNFKKFDTFLKDNGNYLKV